MGYLPFYCIVIANEASPFSIAVEIGEILK